MYCKLLINEPIYIKIRSINSSKVYCKYCASGFPVITHIVLIVAKCIVNYNVNPYYLGITDVLIVAKCIVNTLTINSG